MLERVTVAPDVNVSMTCVVTFIHLFNQPKTFINLKYFSRANILLWYLSSPYFWSIQNTYVPFTTSYFLLGINIVFALPQFHFTDHPKDGHCRPSRQTYQRQHISFFSLFSNYPKHVSTLRISLPLIFCYVTSAPLNLINPKHVINLTHLYPTNILLRYLSSPWFNQPKTCINIT